MATNEALDVLYRAMQPALYCCIAMAIENSSDSPSFFVVVNSLLPTTIAKKHSNNQFTLKPSKIIVLIALINLIV